MWGTPTVWAAPGNSVLVKNKTKQNKTNQTRAHGINFPLAWLTLS